MSKNELSNNCFNTYICLLRLFTTLDSLKKIALKKYNFIGCSHLLFPSFIYYCCLWHSTSYCWNHSFLGQIIFKRKRQCYKNQWVILNWVSSSTVKVKIANIKCTIWNINSGHVIPFLSHWQNGSLTPEPLQRVSSFTLLNQTIIILIKDLVASRCEIQNILKVTRIMLLKTYNGIQSIFHVIRKYV